MSIEVSFFCSSKNICLFHKSQTCSSKIMQKSTAETMAFSLASSVASCPFNRASSSREGKSLSKLRIYNGKYWYRLINFDKLTNLNKSEILIYNWWTENCHSFSCGNLDFTSANSKNYSFQNAFSAGDAAAENSSVSVVTMHIFLSTAKSRNWIREPFSSTSSCQ